MRPVVAGLLAGAVGLTTFAQRPNLLQLTGLILVVLLTTAYEWQEKTGGVKRNRSQGNSPRRSTEFNANQALQHVPIVTSIETVNAYMAEKLAKDLAYLANNGGGQLALRVRGPD